MPTGNGTDSAAVASITASTFLQPVLIGAGIGMLFNVLRFTLTKNKRSFVSQSMIIASEYQVQVPSDLVSKAQEAAAKAEVAS
jgi:predicted permease